MACGTCVSCYGRRSITTRRAVLDQIEVAERVGWRDPGDDRDRRRRLGYRVDTPIDEHAAAQTTSVYTAVHTFPMLPEELSTGPDLAQ